MFGATFEGLIGLNLLTQMGANLCLKGLKLGLALVGFQIKFGTGFEPIHNHRCVDANFTKINESEAPIAEDSKRC